MATGKASVPASTQEEPSGRARTVLVTSGLNRKEIRKQLKRTILDKIFLILKIFKNLFKVYLVYQACYTIATYITVSIFPLLAI